MNDLMRIGLLILQKKLAVKLLNKDCVETVVYTEEDVRTAFQNDDIIAVG